MYLRKFFLIIESKFLLLFLLIVSLITLLIDLFYDSEVTGKRPPCCVGVGVTCPLIPKGPEDLRN